MSATPGLESGMTLGTTESVCPVCLRHVTAERIAEGDAVYLRKSCPEHGVSKTVIWRGLASYAAWGADLAPPRGRPCAVPRSSEDVLTTAACVRIIVSTRAA